MDYDREEVEAFVNACKDLVHKLIDHLVYKFEEVQPILNDDKPSDEDNTSDSL